MGILKKIRHLRDKIKLTRTKLDIYEQLEHLMIVLKHKSYNSVQQELTPQL